MNTLQSILMVVTSFSEMAGQEPTGIWLEEFAVPYQIFTEEGYEVTVASIQGGQAPVDPRSAPDAAQAGAWKNAVDALKDTQAITDIQVSQYAAVFMPGGHGTMFDFPDNPDLQRVLNGFAAQNKIIAAMCHGPAALVGVTLPDGSPLVAGKTLTSFTNAEESAAGFTEKMPFLLETRLRDLGARFVVQENWSDHVEIDGRLITGQNPQSSESAARALLKVLRAQEPKQ